MGFRKTRQQDCSAMHGQPRPSTEYGALSMYKMTRLAVAAAACLTLASAAPAAATTVTFYYNCDIVGPSCDLLDAGDPTVAIGQLDITDNGDSVDLKLSLY